MTFGEALGAMQEGKEVFRAGWNGKDIWIGLAVMNGSEALLNGETLADLPGFKQAAFFVIATPSGGVFPWNPSQADLFANDWRIVREIVN